MWTYKGPCLRVLAAADVARGAVCCIHNSSYYKLATDLEALMGVVVTPTPVNRQLNAASGRVITPRVEVS